jgi:hypothetical protein
MLTLTFGFARNCIFSKDATFTNWPKLGQNYVETIEQNLSLTKCQALEDEGQALRKLSNQNPQKKWFFFFLFTLFSSTSKCFAKNIRIEVAGTIRRSELAIVPCTV